ncbi:MAG: lysoplasmalogenase [Anaerolineae bacterium]
MLPAILSILALVTAVLAIWGEYKPTRTQVYIFKPVTTLLIIWIALWGQGDPAAPAYKWLIVAGLIFCLGGDIFLMLPERFFLAGLSSFLVGHWFYIGAFGTRTPFSIPWWVVLLVLYGLFMYRLIQPNLGKMRGAVAFYIFIILVMAVSALTRWQALGANSAQLAAVGAILFVISDSVLALDRFRQKFKIARVIVLSTYWAAQWLIAMSVITG